MTSSMTVIIIILCSNLIFKAILGNRKSEGEQLKNFAETLWKNRRMYSYDFLGNTEANTCPVIEARICRIL